MSLPSFLAPAPASSASLAESDTPFDCILKHSPPLGTSPCLWWAPTNGAARPDTVLIFIPGNPGLVMFYSPFLSSIHSTQSSKSLAILAHGHLGYHGSSEWPAASQIGLTAQIAALLELVDAFIHEYGSGVKIVLASHSMGAWLSTRVLKERPQTIASMLLLFPTISNIAQTPNGRKLSVSRHPIGFLFSSNRRPVALQPPGTVRRCSLITPFIYHPTTRTGRCIPGLPSSPAGCSSLSCFLFKLCIHFPHPCS